MIDELDYDTLGIVSDFLTDDIYFLCFLHQHKLRPKNKIVDFSAVDWCAISYKKYLPYDFIEEFSENLSWYILTNEHKYDIDFIRHFKDSVDWNTICSKLCFDDSYNYDFFQENIYFQMVLHLIHFLFVN